MIVNEALNSIDRLAKRVIEGRVVFFLGAGCSLDSEYNTAKRLMMRLWIQFHAITGVLENEAATKGNDECTKQIKRKKNGLNQTFEVNPDSPLESEVHLLSVRYYEANDWFVGAFDRLLVEIAKFQDASDLVERIHCRAEEIRLNIVNGKPLDSVSICRIRLGLLNWAKEMELKHAPESIRFQGAGKVLFLDTMGFSDERIMGGKPKENDYRKLAASYSGKLFPRFQVMARLAREGYCPVVLTTNYDLLLEGAWRMAGFSLPEQNGHQPNDWRSYLEVPVSDMASIGRPIDFVDYGNAFRRSLIIKMHGCVEAFRLLTNACRLDDPSPAMDVPEFHRLRKYLRSMVFTYREIQNWRTDSWMRDYLATLLRTRTVVFGGYSLQDPVIHDSFRTVYEDISRYAFDRDSSGDRLAEHAPTYFLAPDDGKCSFHGIQVLNAASRAVGAKAVDTDNHDNYVRFNFRSKPNFPHLDELFLWLFHRIQRMSQLRALRMHLQRIVSTLLGRNVRGSEVKKVIKQFEEMTGNECVALNDAINDPARARRRLRQISSWTNSFHPSLLGEFGCGDLIHRQNGPVVRFETLRNSPWYFPATANREWTAWAVVVELAIRRLLGTRCEINPTDFFKYQPFIYPVDSAIPTVFYRSRATGQFCSLLSLETCPVDVPMAPIKAAASAGQRTTWTMLANRSPWFLDSTTSLRSNEPLWGESAIAAPAAKELWRIVMDQDVASLVDQYLPPSKIRQEKK